MGPELLGRVVDPEGRPLDGRPLEASERRSVHASPVPAMQRRRIATPVKTGVRAIDSLVTLGHGQRIGIFAGAGVGKSRLLGGIARHSRDDVVVVALVGERNREVRDFIENELTLGGGLERAVVVVATSDEPPLRRVRCALAATTIAESFRDSGHHVTLLMDSLTRVAMAQREIGLAAGEPPVAKGYTPSVFALMPRLLERAGSAEGRGSITGIYSIFVEGDDLDEPVSDAARAILDGHIVLSRKLAEKAHYPAIDVLLSNSRVMRDVVSAEHEDAAGALRRAFALLRDASDLISIGAYKEGSDPELDLAIAAREALNDFLRQDLHQPADFDESGGALLELARSVRGG